MRFRLPLGRSLFFLCAFLFSLLALLPLRLALDWLQLDQRGFAAREAKGSIWLGGLTEAQFGNVALGDLEARLQTLPLLIGRARVDLERSNAPDRLEAGLTVTRHGLGIEDLTGNLDIGSAFAPLPIASLDATDVTARFADGQCVAAEGNVRAGLITEIAGISLPGGLSGNARCNEGALLLPLVSQTGMEVLNITLFEDGRYQLGLVVRPADDAMRDRLLGSGFILTGSGYALRTSGKFLAAIPPVQRSR